jgi:hypothetical protein
MSATTDFLRYSLLYIIILLVPLFESRLNSFASFELFITQNSFRNLFLIFAFSIFYVKDQAKVSSLSASTLDNL